MYVFEYVPDKDQVCFVREQLVTRRSLKSVVMCQQPRSFLFLAKLYVIKCLASILNAGVWQILCQDGFITHGLDCTRMYIRAFFLKIMIARLGH